jgi:hypothetical protein
VVQKFIFVDAQNCSIECSHVGASVNAMIEVLIVILMAPSFGKLMTQHNDVEIKS